MGAGTQIGIEEMAEEQFLMRLREAVRRYLGSVDAWEAQYQKFYRVPSPGPYGVSPDLEAVHQDYLSARKEFRECVPRARRLCHKYGLREPWQAMLHASLGAGTPQTGTTTAIGRAERNLIAECMAALEAAAHAPEERAPAAETASPRRGILRRIYDFFF
jgi:hypothetical protein